MHFTPYKRYVNAGSNSPVLEQFSPSGEQAVHYKLAHELWRTTAGDLELFHKYFSIQNMGVLQQFWLYENIGGISDVSKYHNEGKWSMEYNTLRFKPKTYRSFGNVL